ncbi:unnamed protein product [Ilex paraguariensis]|uniref:Uncharacterized protein n=1 Tax=Ilex paraguariensis TaxID=185542 RepID=A0ABC8TAM5_9AQUA
MAEASSPRLAIPVVVIGPQFCTPSPVDLIIVKKPVTISEGNLGVTDVKGKTMFYLKGKLLSVPDRRVLLYAKGNPIVSLRQRGDSSDSKDLLFSAMKSSLIQFKTELDVFLATNKKEHVCDFKVKGNWLERSCIISTGVQLSLLRYKSCEKHSLKRVVLGKDKFAVNVYPNIDQAFIVALVVILNEINEDKDD